MTDYRFAFQFLVDSMQIFNVSFNSIDIFKKDNNFSNKNMLLKPLIRNPQEIYENVFHIFSDTIVQKLSILLLKIRNDPNVEIFVEKMIKKLLVNIRIISRVKMERIMLIIKIGINSTANPEAIEALSDLEYCVLIFYPPNRQFLSAEEKLKFTVEILTLLRNGSDKIDKLVDGIDITRTSTTIIESLIKKKDVDPQNALKILIPYRQKLPEFEPLMMMVDSFNSVINMITSEIKFSQLCISTAVKEDEMYVYYYGYIGEKVAGSFSLDFTKLKNIINENYTFYVFYFVTCCYCLDKNNYLGVNLDIQANDVSNMFIFLSNKYLSLFREKIKNIDEKMTPVRIFKHLDKFLSSISI